MMWTGVRTSVDGRLRMAVTANGDDEWSRQVIFTSGSLVQWVTMPAPLVEAIQASVEWRPK